MRAHLAQPLADQLPREIKRRRIVEDQRHNREARLVLRPHLGHARQARHPDFHRDRDDALHFVGRPPRYFRRHLHLNVRDVRECVHGEFPRGVQAERQRDESQHHDNDPVLQRVANQSAQH